MNEKFILDIVIIVMCLIGVITSIFGNAYTGICLELFGIAMSIMFFSK